MAWTAPKTYAVGDVLTASDMNIYQRDNLSDVDLRLDRLDGRVLGYAEVTSGQSGITSETDLTGLSVTVDVPAGRRIKVTGQAEVVLTSPGAGTAAATGRIKESTTDLARWYRDQMALDSSRGRLSAGSVILTPSTGSHTYRLSLATNAGTVGIEAHPDRPAFILVADIGAA